MKTYGTLGYKKGKWIVDAEPHVVVRLKRVFPRVARRQHGKIRITDTLETARDLEWFTARFPLACESPAVAERLRSRADEQRRREHAVAELLSGARPPAEFELALPPREYQRLAADLALTTGGLLVADDVGLGKTCTAICMLTDPRTRPALIVTLTHLPKQWEAELAKFAPNLRAHVIKSGKPYALRDDPDVLICNYHKLAGWSEVLGGLVKCVVFDECQELRRGDASDKGAAAYHIAEHAQYRMGLSATPIYNYGGEIWNVLEAIRPGALGAWDEFQQEWCGGARFGERHARIKDPKAFGTYLRDAGLMLRRTREDVGRELPDLTRVPHHVDCDTKRLEDIDSAASELARVILSQNPLARGERFRAAEELSHLVRQATGIAKAPFVADFVRLLVEGGEKVVLYGWHREVYGLWLERLADLRPALFTGSESAAQKEEARRRFMAGETPVLIMSLRSGAGLDGLQHHGRTVVFGELDWSPGVHEQCIGRLHRDGQRQPVIAYFLVADSGCDPIIADVLGLKRAQIDGIVDPSGALVQKLDVGGDHVRKLAEAYLARRQRDEQSGVHRIADLGRVAGG